MAELLQSFADLMFSMLPLWLLFGVFLVCYHLAWNDFTPKRATGGEEFSLVEPVSVEPVKRRREYTNRELGIYDIDDIGALPTEEQRRLKMEEIIREYSINAPEETATVIKGWLSER